MHLLVSSPESTFVASVAEVPAGTMTGPTSQLRSLPATRRALRQAPAGGTATGAGSEGSGAASPAPAPAPSRRTWLEVIMVAGGNDPLQMYYTGQSSLL